jgi:hypothetical protein
MSWNSALSSREVMIAESGSNSTVYMYLSP